jgi:hypothetical protein
MNVESRARDGAGDRRRGYVGSHAVRAGGGGVRVIVLDDLSTGTARWCPRAWRYRSSPLA